MKVIEHDGDSLFLYAYEMSIRTKNCLESLHIYTIEELSTWRESELLAGRNMGRKSIEEIKNILSSLNLHLRKEYIK